MKKFRSKYATKESEKTKLDEILDIIDSIQDPELRAAVYDLHIAVETKKYTDKENAEVEL